MNEKKRYYSPLLWIVLGSSILSFLISVVLFSSKGNIAADTFDLGRAFYPMIYYNSELQPYSAGELVMSPFILGLFRLLFLCIPDETVIKWKGISYYELIGTALDLRINQYTLILFLFFILFSAVFMYGISLVVFKQDGTLGYFFSLACVLSYPLSLGYREGSIYIYILPLLVLFTYCDNIDNKKNRIVATVLLTIIISLEPSFVFCIVLYLKRRKYRQVGALLSGVFALNLVPLLFYGLDEFMVYFDNLLVNHFYPAVEGVGIFSMLNTVGSAIGIHIRVRYAYLIGGVFIVLAIWVVLKEEREWVLMSILGLVGILYSPDSTISSLGCLFYLVYLILHEQKGGVKKECRLAFGIICFIILISPFSSSMETVISGVFRGIVQVLVWILFLYIILNGIIYMIKAKRRLVMQNQG